MKKSGTGEFLFHYYKKQEASFQVHLYKISLTGSPADVHRIRVGLKKIRAMFALFELVDPHGFSRKKGWKIFADLFKHAGRIRELNVNQAYLYKNGGGGPEILMLQKYFSIREKKIMRNFLAGLTRFSNKELKAVSNKIRETGRKVTLEQLVDKSWELIREKAGIIHKLEIDTADSETIHKVRKHLKAMSAVASLSSALHSDERLDSILTDMRRAEELIGEWHDRSVLLDFMNKFLHRMEKKKGADTKALLIFRDSVQEEAHSLLKQIIPEVHSVLNFIRATLESPE